MPSSARSDDELIRRVKNRSISHAKLKAERAHEHLEAARAEIESFYKLNAPVLTEEDHPEEGEFWLYVAFPDPPERVFILVGDFLHCLRSALDYIAWDLCIIGDAKINPYSQFPIIGELTPKASDTFTRHTKGMPNDARRIIEKLQPYHARNAYRNSPLWRLNKLAIIDKHHRVPLAGITYDVGFFKPTKVIRTGSFNDRHEMVIVLPLIEKSDFRLDPRLRVNPILRFGGKSDGVDVNMQGLLNIYNFVSKIVIPRLASFFTKV